MGGICHDALAHRDVADGIVERMIRSRGDDDVRSVHVPAGSLGIHFLQNHIVRQIPKFGKNIFGNDLDMKTFEMLTFAKRDSSAPEHGYFPIPGRQEQGRHQYLVHLYTH